MHKIADGAFVLGTLMLWYPVVGDVHPALAGVWLGMTALILALAMVVKIVAWSVGLRQRRAR